MSFLAPLALAIAALVAAPIIAHALRRGRAKTLWFPGTRLVPQAASSAQQRSRLEDRSLLALRVLLLCALALLGASPFVQCSRLSLGRTDGASMAVALVVDDSASMAAQVAGSSKLEQAKSAARDLLDGARSGDAYAVVLAGHPARLLTPPTTELSAVRAALDAIGQTDRRTDLEGAIRLAKSSLGEVPHNDLKVVVLSDFATETPLSKVSQEGILAPLAVLRTDYENCSVASARRAGPAVHADVFCTSPAASRGRKLQLLGADGEVLSEAPAEDTQQLDLDQQAEEAQGPWRVRLSPASPDVDAIARDDEAPVLSSQSSLTIGVRADRSQAGIKTGDTTVLRAALSALDAGFRIEPVNLIPDNAQALKHFGALVVDDPAGFTPEVSDALRIWVEQGGVAIALLGPRVEKAPLGSDFSPFVEGALSWGKSPAGGASGEAEGLLGELAASWAEIEPRGRVTLPHEDIGTVVASFSDEAPLVVRRPLGHGQLWLTTLPASVDVSDFALRPAFIALIDQVVQSAALRHQAAATRVGESWSVPQEATLEGPNGETYHPDLQGHFTPPVAGRYLVDVGDSRTPRHALSHGSESITQPREPNEEVHQASQGATEDEVGISREIAFVVLVLGALELALRAWGRRSRSAPQHPAPPGPGPTGPRPRLPKNPGSGARPPEPHAL